MNIAMIYAIAALFAIVLAGPVALLAPVFFAVTVQLPTETGLVADEAVVVEHVATESEGGSAAPFVRIYAARGESRPAVHPWSVCQPRPAVYPLSRTGKPLKGAALRAATAKAGRLACTSHACPVVRS